VKHWTFILVLAAGVVHLRAAVVVSLKDGETVNAESIVPEGNKFRLTVVGAAPRLLEGSLVERVEMPEPANLAAVYAAHANGDTVATLQTMGKLKVELDPFKKIAGARDWWLEAEFLRAHILLSQRRAKDMEVSMKEIAADASDPDAQRHAQAFLAHVIGLGGDPRKALEQLMAIIMASADPDALADAWLFAGHNYIAVNDQQTALLAYLRIPVFYPTKPVALAGARLGAARCYVALEELALARSSLKELVSKQGKTVEGVEGKKLLSQVERDLGLNATAPSADEPTK